SEGDKDFQKQLTNAIHAGLIELKEKYAEGVSEKDEVKIQQIRHKLKPTLSMFDLHYLIEELQKGKEIIESEGFDGAEFDAHYTKLQEKLDHAITRVFE